MIPVISWRVKKLNSGRTKLQVMKIFMSVMTTISVISGLAIPAMADQNPPSAGTGQSDSSLTTTGDNAQTSFDDGDRSSSQVESSVGSGSHLEDSPTSSSDRDGDGVVSEVRQRSLDVDKLKLFTNEGKSGGVESTPRLKTQEDRSGGSVRSGVSDVTIKDELDSDVASVTKIKVNDIVTGVAPFDKNDDPGNDSTPDNKILRSFDRVTYMVEVTTTSDDPMVYYRKTRIGYKITLPVGRDKAVFRDDLMGWRDQSKGYESKVTANADGSQSLTVYRLFEPTSDSPTTTPGTYEVPVLIDVKAMCQGETLSPTFEAWTVPNDVRHRSQKVTADPITISSAPHFDVRAASSWDMFQSSSSPTVWDFTVGADDKGARSSDGMHSDMGKRKGILTEIIFTLDMRYDYSKGIKGLEVPKPNTHLKVSMDVSNILTAPDDGDKVLTDGLDQVQPYFWSVDSQTERQGLKARAPFQKWLPRYDIYGAPGLPWESRTPGMKLKNSGYVTVDEHRQTTKTRFDLTIDSWKVDPNGFPWGTSAMKFPQCGNAYLSNPDCSIRVGAVSEARMFLFNPTEINGKSIEDHYGTRVKEESRVRFTNLDVTTLDGSHFTREADTNNNNASATFVLTPKGSFNMGTYYACLDGKSYYSGNDCKGWTSQDKANGTDKNGIGLMQKIQLNSKWNSHNSEDLVPVMSVNLAKIDDKIFEFTGDLDLRTVDKDQKSTGKGLWAKLGGADWTSPTPVTPADHLYAVKKDGTGWKSDEEQSTTDIDDLDYYRDFETARKHGVIVGLLTLSHETGPVWSDTFWIESFKIRVRNDPSNIGKSAQMTQVAEMWTRQDIVKSGLAPGLMSDSSYKDWNAWAGKQDVLAFRKKLKPTYHRSSYKEDANGRRTTLFRKVRYGADGKIIDWGTGGEDYGDTMLVTGENTIDYITTYQKRPDGDLGKKIYDLDKEQRYVDWAVPINTTTIIPDKTRKTTKYLKIVLPSGLHYVEGSSVMNVSKYTEATPSQGITEGGRTLTPTITTDSTGSTTLNYVIPDARTDGRDDLVRFVTYIGDPTDPDKDVKNGQSFMVKAYVNSSYDMANPSSHNKKYADFTIQVSKTRSSQLATRATTLINETESAIGFRSMISNASTTASRNNVWAVDVLPWNSVAGSNYHGDHRLESIKLNGIGLDVKSAKVYVTSDPKYRIDANPGKISSDELSKWTVVPLRSDGSVDLTSIKGTPTAFAVKLDVMPKSSRLNVDWTMKTSGNHPSDLYVNQWSDLNNTVTAMASIADREVYGVAWWDENEDGVRQPSEKRLAGLTVRLVDARGDTIRRSDGSLAVTSTDDTGSYRITGIPAGANYHVKITPKSTGDWYLYDTTLKQAEAATTSTDSNADSVKIMGRLTAASISLKTFPTTDEMTSNRYVDSDEDLGLMFSVMAMRNMPSTGRHDLLIVGVVLGLTIVMLAMAVITGRNLKRHRQI